MQSGLILHFNHGCLSKNTTEPESGKLVAGWYPVSATVSVCVCVCVCVYVFVMRFYYYYYYFFIIFFYNILCKLFW